MQAGDFLIDNLPEIAEALATLFAAPAVGRVLGKAGQETVIGCENVSGNDLTRLSFR